MVGRKYRRADTDLKSQTRRDQSQAGKDQRGGGYVGMTSPDDALDIGETGAEARRTER